MNPTAGKGSGRLAAKLLGVAVAMFGFGFALVPLYDVFCDLTGFGGRNIQTGASIAAVDESRTVTVEFIASLGKHAYMEFRPATARIKVHPGEVVQTSFIARNLNREPIVGRAIYNVAPAEGALYFQKTECFCFTQQDFGPGEEKEMPLVFSISPDLPDNIGTVSLSYTIYDQSTQKVSDNRIVQTNN
ncbi:MAG: cytochrome c oxidase assembly protein [Pseudomonadota bacterium]